VIISILIPFRNAAKYLPVCLDSIRAQSETNWQVIAVDDGSTDESAQILATYAKNDARFVLLTNSGSGIIEALRLAYAKSHGELITRMDADDIMAPDKLALLKDTLMQSGPGFVATGLVSIFSEATLGTGYQRYERWLNDIHISGTGYQQIYKECVLPSPCWMLWREDLEKVGAFDSDVYPEDYDLCFRLYKNKIRILPVQQVLHFWRDYPERTSRTDPRLADQSFMALKLDRFLELEVQPHHKITIWGAADKGKQLAKLLIAKGVDFDWVCDNLKKEGQTIYQKKILSYKTVVDSRTSLVIVAVVQDGAKDTITQYLRGNHFVEFESYFRFC
jgi:glycosyltransferase involved in cell wall biosynthesis